MLIRSGNVNFSVNIPHPSTFLKRNSDFYDGIEYKEAQWGFGIKTDLKVIGYGWLRTGYIWLRIGISSGKLWTP
jgi:hypothetical protein